MAQNSLYPGFIKLHYYARGRNHIATLPVKPFIAVGGQYWLEQRDSVTGAYWQDAIMPYVSAIRPLLDGSSTVDRAELWTMNAPTGQAVFRDVMDLSLAGTASGTATSLSQGSVSYRTANGGILRLVLLDGMFTPNNKYSGPNFGTVQIKGWVNSVLAGQSCIVGRDGSFPITATFVYTKTNDALRKRAFFTG